MHSSNSIIKFLSQELSGISNNTATNILTLLNEQLHTNKKGSSSNYDISLLSELDSKGITILSQILRDYQHIKPPTHILSGGGSCLSPVGEYNLRLGVLKELKPKLIATYSDVSTNSHANHHYEGILV